MVCYADINSYQTQCAIRHDIVVVVIEAQAREQTEHWTGLKYIEMYIRRLPFHSTHSRSNSQSVGQSVSMKTFNLSDDRIVVVKKEQGSQYVIMKQKYSATKYVQFTANR